MIKSKIIKIIILTIIFLLTINNNFIYGTNINLEDYKPTIQSGTKVVSIVSSLLSVLTVLGVVCVVIVIALIGFNEILGSAEQKAEAQGKLVGIIIAVLMITSGSVLARFIISFAESI